MHPKYIVHDNKEYEKWIKKQPCFICGKKEVDNHHMWHGRSNSFLSSPLCRVHHREYHDKEWQAFEKIHNIECAWELIKLLSRYIDGDKK